MLDDDANTPWHHDGQKLCLECFAACAQNQILILEERLERAEARIPIAHVYHPDRDEVTIDDRCDADPLAAFPTPLEPYESSELHGLLMLLGEIDRECRGARLVATVRARDATIKRYQASMRLILHSSDESIDNLGQHALHRRLLDCRADAYRAMSED
jgi:hypothetical protein